MFSFLFFLIYLITFFDFVYFKNTTEEGIRSQFCNSREEKGQGEVSLEFLIDGSDSFIHSIPISREWLFCFLEFLFLKTIIIWGKLNETGLY